MINTFLYQNTQILVQNLILITEVVSHTTDCIVMCLDTILTAFVDFEYENIGETSWAMILGAAANSVDMMRTERPAVCTCGDVVFEFSLGDPQNEFLDK